MRKVFLLFAAIAGLQMAAISQSNFIRGYIVTHDKDTLKGEISDDIYVRNAQIMTFRYDENGPEQNFKPGEINSFFLSKGYFYESRIFSFSEQIPEVILKMISKTSAEDSTHSAYRSATGTAFLRLIVYGRSKLYSWTDSDERLHYFIETPSSGLKELVNPVTWKQKPNGFIRYKTHRTVRDTLYSLASDCDKKLFVEDRNRLNMNDLIGFVLDYNDCMGSESQLILPKSKLKFGVSVGWNITDIKVNESKNEDLKNANFKPKNGILAGITLDSYIDLKEKWAVQLELCYNQKGADSAEPEVHWCYDYQIMDVKACYTWHRIETQYLDFAVLGKYFITHVNARFRPYLAGGLVFGVLLNQNQSYEVYYPYFDTQTLNLIEAGIVGKAGLLFNMYDHLGFYAEFRSSYTHLIPDNIIPGLNSVLFNLTFGVYL
jgi:hypothetical protein